MPTLSHNALGALAAGGDARRAVSTHPGTIGPKWRGVTYCTARHGMMLQAEPGTYLSICVAPKSGDSIWKQLFIRHATGRFAAHYPHPWIKGDLSALGHNFSEMGCRGIGSRVESPAGSGQFPLPPGTRHFRFLVVREPYARLLSGYLFAVRSLIDKSQPALNADSAAWRPRLLLPGESAASPSSFAHFLTWLDGACNGPVSERRMARMLRGCFGNAFMNIHLLPMTSVYHDFKNDHCFAGLTTAAAQTATFDGLLRLDEQHMWYPELVRRFNLSATVSDRGWSSARGGAGGCFWRPPNCTCASMLQLHARGHGSGEETACSLPLRSSDLCTQKSNKHATGSCTQLNEFYANRQAVRIATDFLRGDLDAFGYPSRPQDYS